MLFCYYKFFSLIFFCKKINVIFSCSIIFYVPFFLCFLFLFFVFCLFFGGGDTFSLKLPIFEVFLKNKNLTKICFKMVFYKDHHRMITPNSNIFQRQYNIGPMPHNLFWNRERRIIKNSVRTMKEWLKPLTGRYKYGASSTCFFVKWQLLLWVTFQACKSSIFPPQHLTLESSTLWAFSLVVRCRTERKKRPDTRKNPQNITKAEGSSCPVAIIKVHVPLRSIIYRKFD